MTRFPGLKEADSTLSLMREGNTFISRHCDALGSDAFSTRLLLRKVTCVRGEEAARMFYRAECFTRRGAMPPTTLRLLQDRGSVQTLDGGEHHHRKRLFLEVLSPSQVDRLVRMFEAEWLARLPAWQERGQVCLHDEVRKLLCRVVTRWAGMRMTDAEALARAAEFGDMIDHAGGVGPATWASLLRRRRTERWARRWIAAARRGAVGAGAGVLLRVAAFTGRDGEPLDERTAAVELINLLRPVIAVARYVVFVALALHRHPEVRLRLVADAGDHEYRHMFVQEVRRYYPFFPMVGGRVREPFEWRGQTFRPGNWVLLDLYGTNHDPRLWPTPHRFRPERFRSGGTGEFALVPQGAGDDYHRHHRCPGEPLTIRLMETATRLLLFAMDYEVARQDLRVELARMPAHPRSGFVIEQIRAR